MRITEAAVDHGYASLIGVIRILMSMRKGRHRSIPLTLLDDDAESDREGETAEDADILPEDLSPRCASVCPISVPEKRENAEPVNNYHSQKLQSASEVLRSGY